MDRYLASHDTSPFNLDLNFSLTAHDAPEANFDNIHEPNLSAPIRVRFDIPGKM
jgi:hypothetical protein